MDQWRAYEEEWGDCPTIDDFAAAYFGYKSPGAKTPKDESVMGPADFAHFVKRTGGAKMGPGQS